MPSCSAIDLAEIRRSSKISSWICSIIPGAVTVFGRPGQVASQVEKSPRFNWTTRFLAVAYDGACSPNVSFRMGWIYFVASPCRKKNTRWQISSPCCWNGARRLSATVTRKDLQFAHEQTPLSNDIIESVLWHWEVGRAKDLSAPPRITFLFKNICTKMP